MVLPAQLRVKHKAQRNGVHKKASAGLRSSCLCEQDEFFSSVLHALDHDWCHAFEQFVAKRMVALTVFAQNRSIEKDG